MYRFIWSEGEAPAILNQCLLLFRMFLLGKTPLLYATNQPGNKAIVKYFIDNHADPNKGDSGGVTPLHMASYLGLFSLPLHMCIS